MYAWNCQRENLIADWDSVWVKKPQIVKKFKLCLTPYCDFRLMHMQVIFNQSSISLYSISFSCIFILLRNTCNFHAMSSLMYLIDILLLILWSLYQISLPETLSAGYVKWYQFYIIIEITIGIRIDNGFGTKLELENCQLFLKQFISSTDQNIIWIVNLAVLLSVFWLYWPCWNGWMLIFP